MLRLILMRHAKTEPYSDAGTDETRRLTERGNHDAKLMGEYIRDLQISPNYILVSHARRTRETVSVIRTILTNSVVQYRENLYLAEPEDIVSEITKDGDCTTLMVIGHNPGLHQLAIDLAHNHFQSDKTAIRKMSYNFPTASVAIFEQAEDLPFGQNSFALKSFQTPKLLKGL